MGLQSAFLSLILLMFVLFIYLFINSDYMQLITGNGKMGNEMKMKFTKESKSKSKSTDPKQKEQATTSHTDTDDFETSEVFGGKKFKLYEKKPLNHKKAESFCKEKNGKLAEAMNLEEMRRLQMLILKAKSVRDDIWVGANKKEWKKHSLKMQRRPNFGPDPMMFGGGPTEMCPSLSVSTRSLSPVMCNRELPYICEFEPTKTPTTTKKPVKTPITKKQVKVPTTRKPVKARGKVTTPKLKPKPKNLYTRSSGVNKPNRRRTPRVEMRRKREIII